MDVVEQQPDRLGRRALMAVLRGLVIFAVTLAAADARAVDFSHDVVPILRVHYGKCHTGDARQGGFSMNTRESLLAGGDSGTPGFVDSRAGESETIAHITSDDADYPHAQRGRSFAVWRISSLAGLDSDDQGSDCRDVPNWSDGSSGRAGHGASGARRVLSFRVAWNALLWFSHHQNLSLEVVPLEGGQVNAPQTLHVLHVARRIGRNRNHAAQLTAKKRGNIAQTCRAEYQNPVAAPGTLLQRRSNRL